MITFVRVDDRLIHGQVVTGWTRTKGINFILAVDDEIAANKMQVRLMKMATPPGVKSEVMSVKDASALLKGGKLDRYKVFVVVKNPATLLALQTEGIELPADINIGNVREPEGVKVLPFVLIKKENIESWKELSAVRKLTAQLLPDQPSYNVNDLIKGL